MSWYPAMSLAVAGGDNETKIQPPSPAQRVLAGFPTKTVPSIPSKAQESPTKPPTQELLTTL